MLWEGERVKRAVWPLPDFHDRIVRLLERLRGLFPNAKITRYSEGALEKSPRLSYADPAKAAKMFPGAGADGDGNC